MQITITRPVIQDIPYTIGELSVDGVHLSQVMEDRDRGIYQADSLQYIESLKVMHETAIPYGTYTVVMSYSNKFQKYLPEILNVPGFTGIRIHSGNTQVDTSGCPLPGVRSKNTVINSKAICTKLIALINKKVKKEKVFISILPTVPMLDTKVQPAA